MTGSISQSLSHDLAHLPPRWYTDTSQTGESSSDVKNGSDNARG